MDFAFVGINLAIVAGIVGLTEVIKVIIPDKLKRFILLVPTVLGLAAALIMGWGSVKEVLKDCIIYVGAATYIWKFGKTVIAGQ
jgi:TRAP-type C4-dicarboxylate transport system permease small subunit